MLRMANLRYVLDVAVDDLIRLEDVESIQPVDEAILCCEESTLSPCLGLAWSLAVPLARLLA